MKAELAKFLVASGEMDDDAILVDVGCSISYFRQLDALLPRLKVFAFDPLVAEIERLRAVAPPHVTYEDAFVVSHSKEPWGAPSNMHSPRSTQFAWWKLTSFDNVKENFNAGQKVEHSKSQITLDERLGSVDVDFIKVDTDGHDFQVLEGASGIIERKQLLGALIEVRFHGRQTDRANLWRNVDRILAGSGLSLFDIRVKRYSRAALPAMDTSSGPAKPSFADGQVDWGDALYLRDLCAPDYERMWNVVYSKRKYVLLAALFNILGYEDCAAEVIQTHRDKFSYPDHCLNLLAQEKYGRSYAEHMAQFKAMAQQQAKR